MASLGAVFASTSHLALCERSACLKIGTRVMNHAICLCVACARNAQGACNVFTGCFPLFLRLPPEDRKLHSLRHSSAPEPSLLRCARLFYGPLASHIWLDLLLDRGGAGNGTCLIRFLGSMLQLSNTKRKYVMCSHMYWSAARLYE